MPGTAQWKYMIEMIMNIPANIKFQKNTQDYWRRVWKGN